MTATAQILGSIPAPDHVLTQLREIDPGADLIYLGDGEWLLGVRSENKAAAKKMQKLLVKAASAETMADPLEAMEQAKRLELLQLYATGFRPVAIYDTPEESVNDFRQRDWRWKNEFDETLARKEREAMRDDEKEASERRYHDYFRYELPHLHRILLRGTRSIVQRINPFN